MRKTGSILNLRAGEAAIFGYGSLLSNASLEKTLGRDYKRADYLCKLVGWRRSWDIAMPNETFFTNFESERIYPSAIIYLNVMRDKARSLNGNLIIVTEDEIRLLDEREWIYDRIKVTDELQGIEVVGGDAYVYSGKRQYIIGKPKSIRVAAVRSTYLNIVENGLDRLGTDFKTEYERSTDLVPSHLIIQDLR